MEVLVELFLYHTMMKFHILHINLHYLDPTKLMEGLTLATQLEMEEYYL